MENVQARNARDIAIECMGRLDSTAATVKESCSEAFTKRYLGACAQTMGGVGDIINVSVRAHPELKPSQSEWSQVASQRRAAVPPPPELKGQQLVQAEVEAVSRHVQQLRSQGGGSLSGALDDIEASLPALKAVLQDWEPRF
jgi:hypothetical protein